MGKRMNILTKQLTIMLVLTVVPLIVVGFLALDDAKTLGYNAAEEAEELGESAIKDAKAMGNTAIEDSTTALRGLGEDIIKQKARDSALAIKGYLQGKDMTLEELKNDEFIRKVALAPVGETGYNCLYECKKGQSGYMRIHPNEGLVDYDMSGLKEKLPEWWDIFKPSLECVEVSGYYDWEDEDGSIRPKFMTMTPVEGTPYMIAATTYIDEFSQPAEETAAKIESAIARTQENINEKNEKTVEEIKSATEGISTQNTIFMITALTIIIVVIIGIISARNITVPVVDLTNAANRVLKGDLDVKIRVKSNDEIKDLATAMEALVGAVKFFRKGDKK